MTYTREHPSAEYVRSVELGKEFQQSKKVWTGKHCLQQYPLLKQLVKEHGSKSLLDWGAGKLDHLRLRDIRLLDHKDDTVKTVYPTWQEALGVDLIHPYDPCVEGIDTLPERQFDGCYSVDVLQYVPAPDLTDWTVDLMFSFVTQWLFASIPCYQGKKTYSDGSTAHQATMPFDWWVELFSEVGKRHPAIEWHLRLEVSVPPISHRYFRGMGEQWAEYPGFWAVWKPAQLESLTQKQREELEMIARNQKTPIDPRAFGKKGQE